MRSEEWIRSTAGAPHDFAGTLRVLDVHPEEGLDDQVKTAAGEPAHAGLGLVQDGARQPARANDAVRSVDELDKVMKGVRGRGAVRIDIADHVGRRGQLEPFDEGAAFADGVREILGADAGEFAPRRAGPRPGYCPGSR